MVSLNTHPPDVSPPLFTDQSEGTKLFVYIHEAIHMHRRERTQYLSGTASLKAISFSNAHEVLMFSGVHFYLSNFSLYLHPLMSRSVNIFIFYFPCFHSLLSGYIMGCNYLTIISNIKFCNIRNKVLLYTPVA